MRGRKQQSESEQAQSGGQASFLIWLLRLTLFVAVIGLCLTAGLLLYGRWQDARLARIGPNSGGGTHLNLVQRLYLRGYLASRAGELTRPAGSGEGQRSFIVDPGQRADEIAANLRIAGLLNDEELFLNYLRYYDLDPGLEAGAYEVNPKSTIPELAATLSRADDLQVDLTFVEGWRLEEMARYLELLNPAQIDSDEFLAHARRQGTMDLSNYEFLSSLPEGASLEGFLFPDTYRVPVEADAALLVGQMLDNFDRRVTPGLRQSFGAEGLSVYEAVTLASIVQREAVLSEERPLMVGVFLNRLEQGMLLQADPTVQYAVGYQPADESWWKVPLYQADLDLDSAYNTYRYEGLPPGPIANPGLGALQAVARPEKSDFLFFVVDCESETVGEHVFSKTFEEHLARVEQCR
ncbi:MAG TPA: endolytic transglycosylase MltG [Anaerolineae bacterium]|jgi:UPF0755 protein|nr:endolytic transglycosylase MltG [Anaerolineae bacterium]